MTPIEAALKAFPDAEIVGIEPLNGLHNHDAGESGFCFECDAKDEELERLRAEVAEKISPAEAAQLIRYSVPSRACANCMREALDGLNYHHAPLCTTCAPHAGSLDKMTTDTEEEAIEAGGMKAGEYLDGLAQGAGKYDLADLSPHEWRTFLARVLEGYSEHMREAVKTTAPF
jgi:hypothetical protein